MDMVRIRVAFCLVCCLVQYMGEIVSLCTLLRSCNLQFNLRQSPIQWNVDFNLVDEKEKNRMQEESHELGALISKL